MMATADSVKAKIQGLINKANETTGQNDATLTEAVNHLKDGYGQGGGGDNYYDTFWDNYQDSGNRASYADLFSGGGWNNNTFKPKYDIRPLNGSMSSCFYASQINGDLVEILAALGLVMDTSKCTSFNSTFNSTWFTRLGVIDTSGMSSSSNLTQMFISSKRLVTIDKLILKSDGSQSFTNTFAQCSELENITIEGVIGNTIDLHWSTKLSKASITSIINALAPPESGISGLTVTLSQAAVDRISEEENSNIWWWMLADKNDGIRPNWNIVLA